MNINLCPLCNSANTVTLYAPLVRCQQCGLVRTQAQPAANSVMAADYDQHYFTERNAYLARADEFKGYFETLLNHVQPHQPTGRLLDVGCGPGLLLGVAQGRGYHVSGCDVSAWATQHAREQGLDVRTGLLADLAYPANNFDVIVCSHTLEHVPQPLPFLTEMRRILADAGTLVIGVPNFASLHAWALRGRWSGLLPDQHYWHFTPNTLRAMLGQAGFATRQLIIQTGKHQHPNPIKKMVLRGMDVLSGWLGRGEALLALAGKAAVAEAGPHG